MSTPGDAAHPNAASRVYLVSHAPTPATRRTSFPADEPVENAEDITPVDLGRITAFRTGPELRCRQTAEALGWSCEVDPALADLDFGSWRGRAMTEVDDMSWLVDPSAAPHGGESVQAVLERVGSWLDGLCGSAERVAAVTHPSVVRAAVVHALGAPVQSFWRIDVVPMSLTRLSGTGRRWTLRATGHPLTSLAHG